MKKIPSSMRPHIGIFGKRNAGKSSLINALTGQDIAIVSDIPGTTTDPVGKAMEILPLGPVYIVDTAGLDDIGELGEKRIKSSLRVLGHSDLIIVVSESDDFNEIEKNFIEKMLKKNEKIIVVFSKYDIKSINKKNEQYLKNKKIPFIYVSAKNKTNIRELRELMAKSLDEIITSDIILRDLINEKDIVIHVMPIDSAAPKGRIILPQEQALRDTLDKNALSMVVQTDELEDALKSFNREPALVVTDSQAIEAVNEIVPNHINITTYSILFSRLKGDLLEYVRGLKVINELKDGDEIFIAEACTHHSQPDDIGRYKIPKWLKDYTKKRLKFTINPGRMIHKDFSNAKLIIQCGGCMVNRKEILHRISLANDKHIPITNYGVLISHLHNALERTIKIFEDVYNEYKLIIDKR